jgi:DNA-binding transcriptional ArsR family regulator
VSDEHWYEDETGSLVRPYTVTQGRTEPSGRHTIDLMSQVTAVEAGPAGPDVDHARAALLALVRRGARPVVELAADADLPLTVVRVLLGDLAEAGLVRIDRPHRVERAGPGADPALLKEIIERLREL